MTSHQPPMSHQEVQELLGAYALDAVDPELAAIIEDHLRHCARCRAGGRRAPRGGRALGQLGRCRADRPLAEHR